MEFKNSKNSSAKIKSFLEYFSGHLDKLEKEKKSYDRAKKLEKMIQIYEGNDIDLEKVAKMHDLYKKSEDFVSQFSDLQRYSDDSVLSYFVAKINAIADYYKSFEQNGLVKASLTFMSFEEKGFFDDYIYANEYVTDYIYFEDSPYINDFLARYNLRKYEFDRYIEAIKSLDPDLYNRYLTKEMNNKELRKKDVLRKISNLIEGVKTGKLGDNTDFNTVEYFANLPFYDDVSSKEVLNDFGIKLQSNLSLRLKALLFAIDNENTPSVLNYANANRLNFDYMQRMISKKEIIETNIIMDHYKLTLEDKIEIINYMRKRKIPFLPKAFDEVKKKYLKEGLENKTLRLRK